MNRYKILLLTAIVGLSIPLLVAPAPAWEFSMDGAFTWEFEYRGQGGREGFFGPYDVDAGSGIATAFVASPTATTPYELSGAIRVPPTGNAIIASGPVTAPAGWGASGFFAPLNFWLGGHMPLNDEGLNTRGTSFASGSEGSWQTIYMNTNMQIRMNQALRVRGNYYIGSWNDSGWPQSLGDMVAPELVTYQSPGVKRSFSPGYWRTLWLTAELPWGVIGLGKRSSTWGTGLGWNGEDNRSSESLAFLVPYGPFMFQISLYPSRRGATGTEYYNKNFDKNNARWWDMVLPSVTYRNGPVDMGFLFNFVHSHTGGEGQLTSPLNRQTLFTYRDFDEVYGGVYIKYMNGRMFFNSEVDWDLTTTRNRRKLANGAEAPNIRDTYREHWRFMAEGGVLAGPSKVSVIYAWLAGPDRRNGAQIDRSGLNVDVGIRSNSWSNTGLFRPYSYLMVYSYGLGTHFNADTRNGTVEDASILAARVDYAVASNLNVYGSFFWADRTNKSGYGWGFMRPDVVWPYGKVRWEDRNSTSTTFNVATSAPNIPDPNLGYEIGAGMDWKLLENFTVNLSCSYWKPGKWFSYACVDKAMPLWDTITGGPYGWGVWPERNIDPVWGLELKVVGNF
jgi:opacity protein-like surface antigen